MLVAFIWIFSSMLYLAMTGVSYQVMASYGRRCGMFEPEPAAGLTCLAWPVILPIVLAVMTCRGDLGLKFKLPKREDKDLKRRQREIAEAEHRLQVAKILEQENRILDRQLNH